MPKRFPSFTHLLDRAKSTLARFPLTLISAIKGTICAIILVEVQGGSEYNFVEKIMLVCSLGLPLFTAMACFAEKNGWDKKKNLLFQAIGIVALIGYYFSLPQDIDDPLFTLQRFLLLNTAFHFLVAFLPYLGANQENGYWQYNKSLFLRFLLAALYSAVLFVGLVLALLALDYLFGVDINEHIYLQLWLLIVGVFNTWMFLAGIPKNLGELNTVTEYPKGLKVFTQYILLPLVGLYFLILIAYEVKIVATWNWPKGWVSQMVLWYSVVGILSLLLLYPLREQSENKWIKVFSNWFFRVLIPLVVMLFLAISARIGDYGITENRYFVFAMAVGLAIVVLYFVFSKVKDIRIIPIVICVIALLSAYGPWSAFSVALKSQSNRLEKFMTESGMLVDNKLVKPAEPVPFDEQREMSSVIEYLCETHGLASFSKWLPDSVLGSLDTVNRYSRPLEVAKAMGIEYMPYYRGEGDQQYFDFKPKTRDIITLGDYDYLIDLGPYNVGEFVQKFPVGADTISIGYNIQTYIFTFNLVSSKTGKSLDSTDYKVIEPARALVEKWRTGPVPQEDLIFEITSRKFDIKLIVKEISGYKHEDEVLVNLLTADILLRTK